MLFPSKIKSKVSVFPRCKYSDLILVVTALGKLKCLLCSRIGLLLQIYVMSCSKRTKSKKENCFYLPFADESVSISNSLCIFVLGAHML